MLLFSSLSLISQNDPYDSQIMESTDTTEIDNLILEPKTSGSWVLSPITIDNAGVFDWAWASSQSWCSGSGSVNDPYVIENVKIDAGYSSSGITILNSMNPHFILRNITAYKSGTSFGRSGIHLDSVVNAKIIDCNLSNNGAGIFMNDCNDITISGNILGFNWYGIYFYSINYIINIDDNHILNNTYSGIDASSPSAFDYIRITSNNIENNGEYGIVFEVMGTSNVILDNTIDTHGDDGIYLEDVLNTYLGGNTITNSDLCGIRILNSDNNDIVNNEIYDNGIDGIQLTNCDNNLISANTIKRNGNGDFSGGIITEISHNIFIIDNIVNDNTNYGIYQHDSNYGLVSGNTIMDNLDLGVYSNNGDFQTFTDNTIENNGKYGLLNYYGDYGYLHNNIVSGHTQWGLRLSTSDYSTISNNEAKNNEDGITLYFSDFSIVKGNLVSGSISIGIQIGDYSYYNTISENRVEKNHIAIELTNEADFNTIYHNCFSKADVSGYLVSDAGYKNFWDNNYYDDNYAKVDANGDGISDVSYFIKTANSEDKRPLMRCPFETPSSPYIPSSSSSSSKDDDKEEVDLNLLWISLIIGGVIGGGVGAFFIIKYTKKDDGFVNVFSKKSKHSKKPKK